MSRTFPSKVFTRPATSRRCGLFSRGLFSPGFRTLRLVGETIFALALLSASARGEVQIERTFMPLDASPSSFAIGLPGGVSFCFDPLRCAVSYIWTGGFLDITPVRPGPGKFINAVKLLGPVVYRENGAAPLRRGDPTRRPNLEFTGYVLHDDRVEFRYTIDGIAVREEISVRPDRTMLVRRFHFETGRDAKWWQVVEGQPPSELRREPDGTFVLETPVGKVAP